MSWDILLIGYLFLLALSTWSHMSALDPWLLGLLTLQILSLQFQGLGWYDRDEVLNFSTKMCLSSKIPHALSTEEFFESYISHLAICQFRHRHSVSINTTNIKVCMFKGLACDPIKVWNWDILGACAIEKFDKCKL